MTGHEQRLAHFAAQLTAMRGPGKTLDAAVQAGWLAALDVAEGGPALSVYAPGNGTGHRVLVTDLDRLPGNSGAAIATLGGRFVITFPGLPWRALVLSQAASIEVAYVIEKTAAPAADAVHVAAYLESFLHRVTGGRS